MLQVCTLQYKLRSTQPLVVRSTDKQGVAYIAERIVPTDSTQWTTSTYGPAKEPDDRNFPAAPRTLILQESLFYATSRKSIIYFIKQFTLCMMSKRNEQEDRPLGGKRFFSIRFFVFEVNVNQNSCICLSSISANSFNERKRSGRVANIAKENFTSIELDVVIYVYII